MITIGMIIFLIGIGIHQRAEINELEKENYRLASFSKYFVEEHNENYKKQMQSNKPVFVDAKISLN